MNREETLKVVTKMLEEKNVNFEQDQDNKFLIHSNKKDILVIDLVVQSNQLYGIANKYLKMCRNGLYFAFYDYERKEVIAGPSNGIYKNIKK